MVIKMKSSQRCQCLTLRFKIKLFMLICYNLENIICQAHWNLKGYLKQKTSLGKYLLFIALPLKRMLR